MKTITFAVKKTGNINTDTRALIEQFVPVMLRFLRESYGLSADGAAGALGPQLLLAAAEQSIFAGVTPEMLRETMEVVLDTMETINPSRKA